METETRVGVSEEEERERKSRWFQLSEVQQDELRSMRKRHRTENKQRKILRMDHEARKGREERREGKRERREGKEGVREVITCKAWNQGRGKKERGGERRGGS